MWDRSTIIGIGTTLVVLVWVLIAGAGHSVDVFWRTPGLALVIGGSILATVAAYPGGYLRRMGGVLRQALVARPVEHEKTIITLVALAETARREGLLALEKPVAGLQDGFLKRAMRMTIDGMDAGTIEAMLRREIECTDLRHTQSKSVVDSVARAAPVFGMIGTLIGLVLMLGDMRDPSMIGPGMAVALLTTLYGLVLANVVCAPIARKLAFRSSEELLNKTIALEGVLAVQAGDHPRMVAQKLRAFLPDSAKMMSPVSMPRRVETESEQIAVAASEPAPRRESPVKKPGSAAPPVSQAAGLREVVGAGS